MTFKDFLKREDISSLIATIKQNIQQCEDPVYPPDEMRFIALDQTPLHQIKVVILGQDPYHGEGQANGLAFSCLKSPLPPSLKNIFKAIDMQYGHVDANDGDLSRWASQGVLLWNVYLSVEQGKPLSHAWKAYEMLTQKLIETISKQQKHVVFLLWGKFAQSFEPYIKGEHCVIKTVHPSPLSVYRGFYDANVFIKTNDYVLKHHGTEIDWT